jgi:hypothetical protein
MQFSFKQNAKLTELVGGVKDQNLYLGGVISNFNLDIAHNKLKFFSFLIYSKQMPGYCLTIL